MHAWAWFFFFFFGYIHFIYNNHNPRAFPALCLLSLFDIPALEIKFLLLHSHTIRVRGIWDSNYIPSNGFWASRTPNIHVPISYGLRNITEDSFCDPCGFCFSGPFIRLSSSNTSSLLEGITRPEEICFHSQRHSGEIILEVWVNYRLGKKAT